MAQKRPRLPLADCSNLTKGRRKAEIRPWEVGMEKGYEMTASQGNLEGESGPKE